MFTVLDTNLWLGVIYGRAFPCPFNEFCCFLLGHLSRQKNFKDRDNYMSTLLFKEIFNSLEICEKLLEFFPIPWNLRFSMIGLLLNTQYMSCSYIISALKMESFLV